MTPNSTTTRSIRLVPVKDRSDAASILYKLLGEREAHVNISHKDMPSFTDHFIFVAGNPYKSWFLIEAAQNIVGSCYVTKANEIGVFIFKAHQGNGYGPSAVRALIKAHPDERLLANIAPGNAKSIKMFSALGFAHIQNTYEKT